MHIGEVVKLLRKSKRFTQAELAAAVSDSYDQSNISRFENGWMGLSVQDLDAIAQRLGVTTGDLYALTSYEASDPRWRQWLRVYGALTEEQITLVLGLAPRA